MTVSIQREPIDVASEYAQLVGPRPGAAVATFTGYVRDHSDAHAVSQLELEHYPGMTEAALAGIEAEAHKRWDLNATLIVHRYGQFKPGEQIMMVAAASPHRKAAFEAADFLMDFLKSRAPFWKKETGVNGAEWVESKDTDEDALKRW